MIARNRRTVFEAITVWSDNFQRLNTVQAGRTFDYFELPRGPQPSHQRKPYQSCAKVEIDRAAVAHLLFRGLGRGSRACLPGRPATVRPSSAVLVPPPRLGILARYEYLVLISRQWRKPMAVSRDSIAGRTAQTTNSGSA